MNVVVLGAGIVGVSIADALARRGARVTVLDMRAAGGGATQASAGMLAPYAEAHGDKRLLSFGTRSLDMFDDYVAGLRDATGAPVEYARTGTLEVAFDDETSADLRREASSLAALGVPAEWMDAARLRAFEPAVASTALGALFNPAHGFVGVESIVRALVERATFAGAVFESPITVSSIEQVRATVEVRAGDRQYVADAAVVALGSWSRRVRVRHVAALPVRPVRGQLIALDWSGADRPQRIVWGPHCYTVPWSDGRLLVGATVEEAGFDERPTVEGVHALASAVTSLLPASSRARFDGVRVGLRPALPDGLPAIGPLSRAPRVVMATGHYRNGVLFAPLTATMVSRWLLDGVSDELFAAISPDRFPVGGEMMGEEGSS